jgi:Phosphotransferase enzyme family
MRKTTHSARCAAGTDRSAPGIPAVPYLGHHTICPKSNAKRRGASGGRAIQGSLGEKIGEGAHADVHAWAPGQVLKLFKSGFPRRHSWWEARMVRAAFAAGAPAPEVFDEVTLEGRFGVVLRRLDGPTLLQLSRSGTMTPEQTAIERLAPGDGLCHGDLHPDNVIMTADGPRLIDWGARPARPRASTLRAVTSSFPISPRQSSPIRSGRAQSMWPCSPSTRG